MPRKANPEHHTTCCEELRKRFQKATREFDRQCTEGNTASAIHALGCLNWHAGQYLQHVVSCEGISGFNPEVK